MPGGWTTLVSTVTVFPFVDEFAIPAGTIVAISTFVAYWLARDRNHLSLTHSRTTATIVLLAVGSFAGAVHHDRRIMARGSVTT